MNHNTPTVRRPTSIGFQGCGDITTCAALSSSERAIVGAGIEINSWPVGARSTAVSGGNEQNRTQRGTPRLLRRASQYRRFIRTGDPNQNGSPDFLRRTEPGYSAGCTPCSAPVKAAGPLASAALTRHNPLESYRFAMIAGACTLTPADSAIMRKSQTEWQGIVITGPGKRENTGGSAQSPAATLPGWANDSRTGPYYVIHGAAKFGFSRVPAARVCGVGLYRPYPFRGRQSFGLKRGRFRMRHPGSHHFRGGLPVVSDSRWPVRRP